MSFVQFVALIAALMATNSFSNDIMLPAIPQIARELGAAHANQGQLIIFVFMLGFGSAQLIYGPLSDRFGRRPVLLIGLVVFCIFSVIATFATTFPMLIAARLLQGMGAAAMRVLTVSIVRDCYSGRTMARVMSLAMIVFLIAPIIAPTIGAAVLVLASWQWIFGLLAVFGLVVTVWCAWKLPETLHPEYRMPLSASRITAAFKETLTNRRACGYMLAAMMIMGSLFAFINSVQQIVADALGAGERFTLIFALIGGSMAVSSFVNSRVVERLGTRKVSHAALLGFIACSLIHLVLALSGRDTLISFAALMCATMFCFGMLGPNFNAMAIEPLGHIAGTASSVQGFCTVSGAAIIGFAIGQQFNGTGVPMAAGFVACSVLSLMAVLITERGKLFGA